MSRYLTSRHDGDDPGGASRAAPAPGARVRMRAQCAVPELLPVRAGGRSHRRLRRALYGHRRLAAAGLAVAAAALAASVPHGDRGGPSRAGPGGDGDTAAAAPRAHRSPSASPPAARVVSAPVRIADAASVRLLHPGDRVDVISGTDRTGHARVVAQGVRVARVPDAGADPADGALVVLRVPRGTATALAGAAASSRLTVALC